MEGRGDDVERGPKGRISATKVVGGFTGETFEEGGGKHVRKPLLCNADWVDEEQGMVGELGLPGLAYVVAILQACRTANGVDG